MATRTTPFALTAAALASAATFATAMPDLVAARELSAGSAISPTRLSAASYELTAFADITVQGLNDAYWFGWGGYIQEDDPYYGESFTYPPYPQISVPIYVDGVSGVLYYLIDNFVDQFTDQFDLDNYYFEIGALNGGIPNATFSGAGALLYVGAGELFGTDSPIFHAIDTIVHAGVTDWLQLQFTSLVASLVPKFYIGPVEVGGGILSSLYFYRSTPDGTFVANSIGLPAIWSYISYALTGLVPDGAVVTEPDDAPASAAAVESKFESVEHASAGVGGFRNAPAAAPEESADLQASSVTEPSGNEDSAPIVETETVEAPSVADVSALDAGTAADQTAVAGGAVSVTPDISATADSAPDADSTTTAKDVTPDGKTQSSSDKAPSKSAASSITGKVRAGLGSSNSSGGKHRADGTGRSSSAAKAASANAA